MDARKFTTLIPRVLIRSYQIVRTGSPRRCRFFPTCSDFMLESLETKGFRRGLGSGFLRILKCHPWHPGGYDPVTAQRSV